MKDVEIIGMLKSYVQKSLVGVGALKGAPCKIQSITDGDGFHTVKFEWTDDGGTSHTSDMIVNDGSDIASITQDGATITVTLSDGTAHEFIVPTVQGPKGDKGDTGEGLPEGGTTGQVLVKKSSIDYDMEWDTLNIPSKTSDLTNDNGFITKVVNDLVNYYLKSETYSKTEVDDIVTAIKNSRFEVVAALPTTDIKTNVIYLVPKSPSQTSNVKDEYINLDGTTAGWEKIGDTEIDLSDYVTTQALNTALANYTTTADLTTLLAGKQDTLTFDNAPTENSNNPVKSGGVYADEKSIYEVMGQMGAKNLIYVEDFTLIKSSARTKSLTTEDFGNDIPKTQVTLSFEVSDSNLTENGEFRAYAPSVSGVRELLGGVPYMADGTYSFSFDATKLDQLYIFINNEDETTATCKIGNVMIRFANDSDATYQPYSKTNQELTRDTNALAPMLNELGAKNLAPITLESIKAALATSTYTLDNNNQCTINGVTLTVTLDSDGNVAKCNVNGTASADTYFRLWLTSALNSFGSDPLNSILYPTKGNYTISSGTDSEDVAFVYQPNISGEYSGCYIRIDNGKTVNVDVYPMLRYASIADDTYVPYAKTNRELTEELTVESGDITRLVSFSAVTSYGVRKYGKVVELYFAGTLSEAVNTWTDFLTVPEGFRPSHYVQIASFNTYSSCKNLQLAPSGGIQSASNLSSGDFIRFSATYIID